MLVRPVTSAFFLTQGPVGTAFPQALPAMPSDLPSPDAFAGVFAKAPATPSGGGVHEIVFDPPRFLSFHRRNFENPLAPWSLRVRAVQCYEDGLAGLSRDDPDFWEGLHALLDLTIDPKVSRITALRQYFHPEDDARLLRTAAMAVFVRQARHLPEGVRRDELAEKLLMFQEKAFKHLKPFFIKAPKEWDARDLREAENTLGYFWMMLVRHNRALMRPLGWKRKVLDVNQPLRGLMELALREMRPEISMERFWRRSTTARVFLSAGVSFMVTAEYVLSLCVLPLFTVALSWSRGLPAPTFVASCMIGSMLIVAARIGADHLRASRFTAYLDRHRQEIFSQIEEGELFPAARLPETRLSSPVRVRMMEVVVRSKKNS